MATQQELNVKFKVDATELKTGSEEAKRQVKDAADTMASDVRYSGKQMEESFNSVSTSTDKITSATKTATNAVKDMEHQVASSSASMAKNLDRVANKINAGMIGRVLGMTGRLASHLGSNLENLAGESEFNHQASAALTGGGAGLATGAQIGMMFGPIGAALGGAAGALIGAGKGLMDAASELKAAAREAEENRYNEFDAARAEKDERKRQEFVRQSNAQMESYIGTESEYLIYAHQKRYQNNVRTAQSNLDKFIDEHDGQLTYSEEEIAELRELQEALEMAKRSLVEFTPVMDRLREVTEERRAQAKQAREDKARADKEAAEAKRKEEERNAERLAKQTKEEEARVERALQEKRKQQNADAKKSEQQKLKEGEATLASLQRELYGVASSSAFGTPTDALTRIGGGVGYASYNNSVEQVQRTISHDLKKLIDNQTTQNKTISDKLEELIRSSGSSSAVFGKD